MQNENGAVLAAILSLGDKLDSMDQRLQAVECRPTLHTNGLMSTPSSFSSHTLTSTAEDTNPFAPEDDPSIALKGLLAKMKKGLVVDLKKYSTACKFDIISV